MDTGQFTKPNNSPRLVFSYLSLYKNNLVCPDIVEMCTNDLLDSLVIEKDQNQVRKSE